MYGFNTDAEHESVAALMVYVTYRSRDTRRFKVSLDMWGQIERSVRDASKRATTLPRFLEKLKPKLSCSTLSPRWTEVGIEGGITLTKTADGGFVQLADQGERRDFLTTILRDADHKAVLDTLHKETGLVIALVRERLDQERPVEKRFAAQVDDDMEVDGSWMQD